jgi:hypothetical protein
MNVNDVSLALPAGAMFFLQYANATTGPWTTISTSTAWTFFNNPSIADGQTIITTLLPSSDIGESYDESNPTAASPNPINPGQEGEWDFSLFNSSATSTSDWYFRLIYSSGTLLTSYARFPELSGYTPPPPPPPPPPPTPPAPTGTVIGGGGAIGVPPPGSLPKPPRLEVKVPPPSPPPSPCDSLLVQRVDLNGDCRVDIVDLSIIVYFFGRSDDQMSRFDLNNDGVVELVDVSILMFYWTS